METPKVSVIIVNFNGKRFLKDCLDSISNQNYPNYEIILVDNGSTDGSAEFVEKNYPHVNLIKNEKNLGFAEGNNVGIRGALKDPNVKYVALLNNDTVVERNWLFELVRVAEENAVDMVGSKIFFKDTYLIHAVGVKVGVDGEADSIGFGEADRFKDVMETFAPHAAAALYSRRLLEDVKENGNYLDPDFFAYLEDVDLAFRARLRGYKCLFSPGAVVHHHWAGTASRAFLVYHGRRNKLYFIIKNYPTLILLKYFPIILIKEIKRIGFAVLRKEFFITLKAKIDSVKKLTEMLSKRRLIQRRKKVSDEEVDKWLVPWRIKLKKK